MATPTGIALLDHFAALPGPRSMPRYYSADGFWPTPGPSTYGRPSRSGGLAWTGEPKWICSSSFVESMNLVLGR